MDGDWALEAPEPPDAPMVLEDRKFIDAFEV